MDLCQCPYLGSSKQETDFVLSTGVPKWTRGLSTFTKKIPKPVIPRVEVWITMDLYCHWKNLMQTTVNRLLLKEFSKLYALSPFCSSPRCQKRYNNVFFFLKIHHWERRNHISRSSPFTTMKDLPACRQGVSHNTVVPMLKCAFLY